MAVPYFPTIKNDWRINNMLKIKTESFPSIKIGRNWLVEEEALKQWLSDTKEIKLDYSKL